nr:hypothetical protein [Desulfuromonadales bacterium]
KKISEEIYQVEAKVAKLGWKPALEGHIEALQKLAPRAGVPTQDLDAAVVKARARFAKLERERKEAESLTFEARSPDEGEDFDDAALRDLFAPLARR